MDKLTIYIAGPMRGYDDNNFPAFYSAEKMLENKKCWDVVNPARMDDELYNGHDDINYKEAMRRDIDAIFNSDAVYMMRGWEKSYGAVVEHALAVYLDLYIHYE